MPPHNRRHKGPRKPVRCLGWCGKMFLSPDPVRMRFCKRCADKKRFRENEVIMTPIRTR